MGGTGPGGSGWSGERVARLEAEVRRLKAEAATKPQPDPEPTPSRKEGVRVEPDGLGDLCLEVSSSRRLYLSHAEARALREQLRKVLEEA